MPVCRNPSGKMLLKPCYISITDNPCVVMNGKHLLNYSRETSLMYLISGSLEHSHTVTFKTIAMPNPNTAHEARCNHPWELHLALVGTNKVQTIGYNSVPGSCDVAHPSWWYSHSKMTTPLQRFCTLGIDQAFGTWYNLLLPWLLLKSFEACSQSISETPQLVPPSISLESPPITHKS